MPSFVLGLPARTSGPVPHIASKGSPPPLQWVPTSLFRSRGGSIHLFGYRPGLRTSKYPPDRRQNWASATTSKNGAMIQAGGSGWRRHQRPHRSIGRPYTRYEQSSACLSQAHGCVSGEATTNTCVREDELHDRTVPSCGRSPTVGAGSVITPHASTGISPVGGQGSVVRRVDAGMPIRCALTTVPRR